MTKHNKTVEGLRAKYKFLKPFKIKQDAHQIKILDEMLELARNEGREEERERIKAIILPRVQKFIDKVETGRARSKETYSDMLFIKAELNQTKHNE